MTTMTRIKLWTAGFVLSILAFITSHIVAWWYGKDPWPLFVLFLTIITLSLLVVDNHMKMTIASLNCFNYDKNLHPLMGIFFLCVVVGASAVIPPLLPISYWLWGTLFGENWAFPSVFTLLGFGVGGVLLNLMFLMAAWRTAKR